MSVIKGEDGSRSIEVRVEVPGTPEEVWAAIATGPGISCWFTPTTVEERVGGTVTFELGPGMESTGQITTWDAPRLLEYEEREWMEGAPTLATEVHVEAKGGGTCVVRMVHSLFASGEDWDEQLESMEKGWPPFFTILREYMTLYRGMACTSVRLLSKSTEDQPRTWERLQAAFGLKDLAIEQPFRSRGAAGLALAGSVIELGTEQCPQQAMLRLDQPGRGFAVMGAYSWGGDVLGSASFYFYGDEASAMAAAEQGKWQAWFADIFCQATEV